MGSGIAIRQLARLRATGRLVEIDQQREAGEYRSSRRNRGGRHQQGQRPSVAPSACQLEPVSSAEQVERADPGSYARYITNVDAADNAAWALHVAAL
jgi:hypothetical protein